MEVKVTLIVVLLAAIAISAHAQRDNQERGGRANGRERGEGRRGRPGSDGPQMGEPLGQGGGPRGGRRRDGPGSGGPLMEGRGENNGPDMPEGGRRFNGRGSGGFRPGRPSFGQGGRRDGGEGETDAAEPLGDGQGWSGRFDGPRRFGGRRHEGRGGRQHNDSSEEDGHRHRHHHNRTDDHDHHNHTGHRHHHRNKTGEWDQDRTMSEIRPFRFNPFGRKPFGERPFGRRNDTEEGFPGRDGHRRRHGHKGRWHESESEEDDELTTGDMTTSAAVPEVIEVDLNESDMNIIGEV